MKSSPLFPQNNTRISRWKAAVLASLLLNASHVANAQYTWTGAFDNNWTTGANWSSGTVPPTGNSLIVFGASERNQINLSASRLQYNILFTQESQGYTFDLTGTAEFGQSTNAPGDIRNSYGAGHVTYNYALRITSGGPWTINSDSLSGMTFDTLESTRTSSSSYHLNGLGGGTIKEVLQGDAAGANLNINLRGGGEWTFNGKTNATNATTIRGGATALLDYSTDNSKKLNDTQALLLGGGKVNIIGNVAGTTATFNGVALSATNAIGLEYGFASHIKANASLNPEGQPVTVSLGTITTSSTTILRITGDAAYTASFTTNGRIIYKNDYATTTDGNVGAYTDYATLPGSGDGNTSTLYSLTGGSTISSVTNFAAGGIKISSTGEGQTLDLGTGNLTLASSGGSVLYTGADDYTINAASFGQNANTGVTHWINTGTATLSLNGAIGSGTAQFRTSGEGTIRLTTGRTGNANRVYVGEGTLIFADDDITGTTANTVGVQSGATLALEGDSTVNENTTVNLHGLGAHGNGALRNLSGNNTVAGNIVLGITSRIKSDEGTLTLQGTLTNAGNSALLVNGSGNVIINSDIDSDSLTYGIDKSGSGTLTLNGNNSYTGRTSVSGGTLILNGGGLNGSHVVLKDGGTLAGSGPIGGRVTVQSGGILSPGNSPGNQTVGTLELNGGGYYQWQVHDAAGTAGVGYDTYTVTHLDLTALSTEFKFTIQLDSLSAISPDVQGAAQNFDPLNDNSWTIASFTTVDTTGLNLAEFNSYFSVNTAAFENPYGGLFSISLSENALFLNYTAVPEPSALLLLLPVAALQFLRRNRRTM